MATIRGPQVTSAFRSCRSLQCVHAGSAARRAVARRRASRSCPSPPSARTCGIALVPAFLYSYAGRRLALPQKGRRARGAPAM
eukprot:12296465-Alexandrium_andersonii.AAC.1